MKYNLDKQIENEIIAAARKYGIERLILFGSRARGDNRERSDIDLAASGGNITEFSLNLDDEVRTLLMFDVVNLDKAVQRELLEEIKHDGVILYEKV